MARLKLGYFDGGGAARRNYLSQSPLNSSIIALSIRRGGASSRCSYHSEFFGLISVVEMVGTLFSRLSESHTK